MKIGIGVTTYKRPQLLAQCLYNIKRFTASEYELYIATDTDTDNRGIALRKNECIYNLRHCDYVFLFDDDCYPQKVGWETEVIKMHLKTNVHHFLLASDKIHKLQEYQFVNDCELKIYDSIGGVFMFITKDVIQKVGGFFAEYERYGFEHIGYSCRIFEAKLTPAPFISYEGLNYFIFSCDYDVPDFLYNKSTVDNEERDRLGIVNKEIFKKDVLKIYRPIVYEKNTNEVHQ